MRNTFLAALFLGVCSLVSSQQLLNNESVIKMVKAGLSDELIATAVTSSPGSYDTSANGLVALKAGGATDKVVGAVGAKAAARSVVAAAPVASPLPVGIDEVGVYYKDKSGEWTALMPEIVNFKTGGSL
jgi:hypothetical protein